MSLKEKIDSLSPKDRKMFMLSVVLITFSTFIVVGMFFLDTKDETQQNRIDVVRNGHFNGNSKNSIGFLIDSWSNCDSTVWGYFKNSKNEEMVEVYCEDTTNFLPLINYIKNETDEPFAAVSNHRIVIQWKLTGRDTFDVDFIGDVFSWKTSRQYVNSYIGTKSADNLFYNIVNNKKMINPKTMKENLNEMGIAVKRMYEGSVKSEE